jgi:hypothetical protein
MLLLGLTLTPAAAHAQVEAPARDTVRADRIRTDSAANVAAMRDSAAVVMSFAASPAAAGHREGRTAGAHGGGIAWRSATAFVVGLPTGVAVPLGLMAHEPVGLAATAAGTLLIARLGAGRGKLPRELAVAAQQRGPEYEQAFRQSYAERIHARRRKATVISGVVGAVTGAALLVAASVAFPIA